MLSPFLVDGSNMEWCGCGFGFDVVVDRVRWWCGGGVVVDLCGGGVVVDGADWLVWWWCGD